MMFSQSNLGRRRKTTLLPLCMLLLIFVNVRLRPAFARSLHGASAEAAGSAAVVPQRPKTAVRLELRTPRRSLLLGSMAALLNVESEVVIAEEAMGLAHDVKLPENRIDMQAMTSEDAATLIGN
mmetsp:Transcript_9174/g.20438  ORF Transcript_9174/g.20438 Transcript_9174/m.20438 type:complete len:124 (-) Transcript_9174:190-561(-)